MTVGFLLCVLFYFRELWVNAQTVWSQNALKVFAKLLLKKKLFILLGWQFSLTKDKDVLEKNIEHYV